MGGLRANGYGLSAHRFNPSVRSRQDFYMRARFDRIFPRRTGFAALDRLV
jgi:hypothetical protein